jgi:hypothetical protein
MATRKHRGRHDTVSAQVTRSRRGAPPEEQALPERIIDQRELVVSVLVTTARYSSSFYGGDRPHRWIAGSASCG